MDILVRQPTICDPSSPFHLQKADLLIRDGIIHSVQSSIAQNVDAIVEISNLFVSPGWVDVFAHFCDPGFEYKETLESGAAAAAAGGFTDVFVVPNTLPALHAKSTLEYIKAKSRSLAVQVHPIGAITTNTAGKELSEMYDMAGSGAIAYSDGIYPVQSAGLLLKALQYVKAIDKTIIQMPDDRTIQPHGLMHEGVISTQLGLPGKPPLAEELMIARDIELVKYTGSKLHFTGISTAQSVALIRHAKAQGLKISCSVSPAHLIFSDEDVQSYDTALKLFSPLRNKADQQALVAGILDGTIDCIASHHIPQHTDQKVIEFEHAEPGMIGLQTAFGAVCTALPEMGVEKLINFFSGNARRLFNLPAACIAEGQDACLTLFQPDAEWTFTQSQNESRSKNSAFFGKVLKGRVAGIIHKNQMLINNHHD